MHVTPKEVLAWIRQEAVRAVDLRFMDFPGSWKHFTIPSERLDEASFEDGFGFDASSVRGWQQINESDMLVLPVSESAFIDPFRQERTLNMFCNILDPITREDYTRDPRNVARKAEVYMRSTGIADTAFFGPELEFFVFDDVRFDQTRNSAFYYLDSNEGQWNTGKSQEPNLGHKIRYREGYFPCPPSDSHHDLRSEMMRCMIDSGIQVEGHHHEVASGGQGEIDLRYDSLVRMADAVLKYKYIVKSVAHKNGKTATFMPKPIYEDNGSGMHVHASLWQDGRNLFAGSSYAGISELGMHAIGGLLKHARALSAITNPTTNSYKRLVPGFDAPTTISYSSRNRSAAVRIPVYSARPQARRIEYRCPDGSANPYLAFSAMLMAMLDGVINRIDPGEPLDRNIYDLGPEVLKGLPGLPLSLEEALLALEVDHDFLMRGDVFTEDVLSTWIRDKREQEVNAIRTRPHPFEFHLYYDV
ncbi:MAG: type I glutamate--ammonia ligase [Gemmataceae bacterium]|jgi:glutamine synthetase|nr:type I glutamate--ammonia ligase [Planctomycetota bacterium]NBU76434.1 type I glutamate--ammonia ligase [Planctomycetota bacterium]